MPRSSLGLGRPAQNVVSGSTSNTKPEGGGWQNVWPSWPMACSCPRRSAAVNAYRPRGRPRGDLLGDQRARRDHRGPQCQLGRSPNEADVRRDEAVGGRGALGHGQGGEHGREGKGGSLESCVFDFQGAFAPSRRLSLAGLPLTSWGAAFRGDMVALQKRTTFLFCSDSQFVRAHYWQS